MKQVPDKDYYSILGVSPDTTAEEIRDAYLARTRIIHPDRFDSIRQPQDWKKANEMLVELNEAYAILRNINTRAQYDNLRADKQQRQDSSPSPRPQYEQKPQPPPTFDLGELTAGQTAFGNLQKNVQVRLLRRQQNRGEDQLQIKLASPAWNYIFIVVLLCWYWYLFSAADGTKWENDTLLWYGGITLAVGALIGRNCDTILRWAKSKLKSYFYVTPLYFIKTSFDIVSFRPIWTLKDVTVTHNYKNGSYKNSDVILKFDGYNEILSLSSKEQVENLFSHMRTFDTRMRTAYANRDQCYFSNNNDFSNVPRSGISTTVLLSKGMQAFVYITSVFMCLIGLLTAISVNEELSRKRWVRHPTPTTYSPKPTPRRIVTPTYPEQPMPYSGRLRTWTSDEGVAPFEIKAAQGSHYLLKLVDAYTSAQVLTVFVRSGSTVEVKVPLGTYQVRYASGNTWYGDEYLFGPETSYSKAEKTFTFEVIGSRISGFTITLYKVSNGNLHTSGIRPTEF